MSTTAAIDAGGDDVVTNAEELLAPTTTPAPAPAAIPSHEAPNRGVITLSVMLASIMQALDNTIANVALPRIQGSLSTTQDQMTWVLTSYIVAAAIMTPLSGWLAGRFGRRRIFLVSIFGFTLASALCGLAQSLPEIVVARLLQGLCGAALIPMSQAVLLDINPPERHAKAMAIWVMAVTIGPILGPALGGWLTENYNWRWVFYINVPFGVLCFLGILTFMPETTLRKSRFDFTGFIALSLAIGAFQLMLDRGQTNDWFSSTETMVEAVVAGVALYMFVVHMMTTTAAPFISPALFKDRNFLTGNVFIFIVGVVLFATLALLPPLLQELMGYPVVLTGLVTAPRGIGTLAAMVVVGRLMGRMDTRWIIAAGFAMTAYSLWQMTHFYLQMSDSQVVWSGLIQGFGTGFVYVPLAAITFATLAPQLRNEGHGGVQPDPQHRQQRRHLGGDDAPRAQHADDACQPGRARHALRRRAARAGRGRARAAGRPGRAQPERQRAGRDDCLQRRLQTHDGAHDLRGSPGGAAAPRRRIEERRTGGARMTALFSIDSVRFETSPAGRNGPLDRQCRVSPAAPSGPTSSAPSGRPKIATRPSR